MKKLCRKKRKELNVSMKDSKSKKVRRKTPNEDGYVSKRSHSCWKHEYQQEENGEYVCGICGYRVKDLLAEDALKDYFSLRTEYKISEIKELMQGLCKISWYRNTRGQKIYYPAEPVTDLCGVITHFGTWCFITDANNNGSFPPLNMDKKLKKIEYDSSLDIRADDFIERINVNWKPDKSRNLYRADVAYDWNRVLRGHLEIKSWYCETADGKTYVYNVWKEIMMLDSGINMHNNNFYIKLYVYGENKELEEIIYRDQDGIYSLYNQ